MNAKSILDHALDHLHHFGAWVVGFVLIAIRARAKRMAFELFFGRQTITKEGSKMQTVQVTREIPKESKEVVDCVAALIADIKAKKSVAEISSDMLPKLITAIEGFSELDDEFKSDKKPELSGYLVEQSMKSLGV